MRLRKNRQPQGETKNTLGDKIKKIVTIIILFCIVLCYCFSNETNEKNLIQNVVPTSPVTGINEASLMDDHNYNTSLRLVDFVESNLERGSFDEATYTDGIECFAYEIPNSWRRRHDPGSIWTYYYPFSDTTLSFLQVQVSNTDFDIDSLEGTTSYDQAWSFAVQGVLAGMRSSGELTNTTLVPYNVNNMRVAYITGDYSYPSEDVSGKMNCAVFVSHGKVLLLSAFMADKEKNLDEDDFLAIVWSVTVKEELLSRDHIYPQTVSSSVILQSTDPPEAIFNSTAAENGLDGNIYFLEGIVQKYFSTPTDNGLEMLGFVLSTTNGDVYIGDIYSYTISYLETQAEQLGDLYEQALTLYVEPGADYSFPPFGSQVKVYGSYVGFSEKYGAPSFYYGCPEFLQLNHQKPTEAVESIDTSSIPTPMTSDNSEALISGSNGFNEKETNKMPVMSGTSLDSVLALAKNYKMERVYADEDFGHGTRCCALESQNGGLTLDVIYSSVSGEILCGSVVTFSGLSTSDEQKNFICSVSSVLCPKQDINEVSKWVKDTVGRSEKRSIADFEYEVAIGPFDNLLYFAGVANWEEWDLSQS